VGLERLAVNAIGIGLLRLMPRNLDHRGHGGHGGKQIFSVSSVTPVVQA
jgi:hypothetical protein